MLETPSGVWAPLAFTLASAAVTLAVYVASRALFSGAYSRGAQQQPFLGGNEPADVHYSASNLYWGFTKALDSYYKRIVPEHTGNINDYMAWLVVVAAVLMVLLGVVG